MWGMLAAVGLASDGSQPDTNVAWPVKTANMDNADELDEINFAQAMASINDQSWEIVPAFKDPEAAEGGDMHFWTKPAVGRYQYAKITMTLRNTTTKAIFDLTQSPDLKTRNQFSADLCQLDRLAKNDKCGIFQMCYAAPTGVANREFVVLSAIRTLEEGTMVSYGCSIDSPQVPEQSTPVRGVTQYTWHVVQVGDDVMVSWNNCFDPRGWTPQFLLSWMKSAATNEFINIRKVLSGKKANLAATECEASEEERQKAKAQAEKN